MVLVYVQWVEIGARYKLEILHQYGKRVKTESQQVSRANTYVCRNYWGKTGREGPIALPLPPLIMNRANQSFFKTIISAERLQITIRNFSVKTTNSYGNYWNWSNFNMFSISSAISWDVNNDVNNQSINHNST